MQSQLGRDAIKRDHLKNVVQSAAMAEPIPAGDLLKKIWQEAQGFL